VTREAGILVVAAVTFAVGIPFDALGPWWAQSAVNVWVWTALVWVAWHSRPTHRRELAACVVLATAGELFLMDGWGLYAYRLGNLPLFVPAGHALAFTTATRLSLRTPGWFSWAVLAAFGPYVGWAAWTGADTQGLLWFLVFAGYLFRGRERRLYGVVFVLALVVETYGTALGGWRYFPVEPWFGLTTTNPPVCIGAIYCTLEVLVRKAASFDAAVGRWRIARDTLVRL
jgi:hypothetical protein